MKTKTPRSRMLTACAAALIASLIPTDAGATSPATSGSEGAGTAASPSYPLHIGSPAVSGSVEELQNASGTCRLNPTASMLEITCSSDQRLKDDIEEAAPALPQLGDMRVRDYTIKETGERKTGVIAQEMLWKHPDMVHMGAEGLYGVEAPNVWLLVKAIQELKSANDDLAARVSADDDAVKEAKDSLADLRARVDALEAR